MVRTSISPIKKKYNSPGENKMKKNKARTKIEVLIKDMSEK